MFDKQKFVHVSYLLADECLNPQMQFDILITFTMKALFDCGKIVEIFSDRTTLDLIDIQYRVRWDLNYNQYSFT